MVANKGYKRVAAMVPICDRQEYANTKGVLTSYEILGLENVEGAFVGRKRRHLIQRAEGLQRGRQTT